MSRSMKTQVTVDREDWERNLRRGVPPNDDEALDRWVNNFFAFWAVCSVPACKRTRGCAGDARACSERFWPHVPDRVKAWFHTSLEAADSGLSAESMTSKVAEKLARFDEVARWSSERSVAGGKE